MKAKSFYEIYDIPHPKKCLPREDEMCEKLSAEILDLLKQLNERQTKTIVVQNKGFKKWVYSSLIIGFTLAGGYVGLGLIKDAEISRCKTESQQKVVYREKQSNPFIPFGMGVISAFAFYKLLDR